MSNVRVYLHHSASGSRADIGSQGSVFCSVVFGGVFGLVLLVGLAVLVGGFAVQVVRFLVPSCRLGLLCLQGRRL